MSSRATRLAFLAAALAVAALAFWLLRQSGAGPAPAASAPADDAAAREENAGPAAVASDSAKRERAEGAAATVAPTTAPQAPLPESVARALSGITGRVVEPDGAPVKGATVELLGGYLDFVTFDAGRFLFEPDAFQPRFEDQKVATAADGRFRFERVDPRLYYLLGVNLGRGRPTIRFVDRTPNPGEHVDLGDVRLDPMLTLRGRVVDERGKPIASARVRATSLPTLAFQAGLGELGPGIGVLVLKGAPFAPMLWSPPRWIEPLFEKLPFPSTTTGPDGAFALAGAPAGPVTLVVDGRDLPASTSGPHRGGSGPDKDLGDVVASRGEEAEIQVVDENGKPVAGAEVRVGIPSPMAKDDVAFARKTIVAGADGLAIAKGIPGTQIAVAARAPEVAAWTILPKAELVGDPVVVRVPAPRTALVRVADLDGKPLDARLAVQRAGFEPGEYVPFLEAPMRASVARVEPGVYRVGGLTVGKYHVYARADGFEIGRETVEVSGANEPEASMQLRSENRVRVLVLGKERGQPSPLEGAQVFGMNEGEAEHRGLLALGSSTTDAKGVAVVRALGTGKFSLVASHPGYAMSHVPVQLPDAKDATIQLLVGGTLEGRVHRAGQPPPAPQMVTIALDSGGGDEAPTQLPRFTVTDLDGRFRVSHLTPGAYTVTAMHRLFDTAIDRLSLDWMDLFEMFNGADIATAKADVRDEETSQADLDLAASGRERAADAGRIRGVVTRNGEPLANAAVFAFGEEFHRARTDEHGRFDLGAMKAGHYQVNVQEPGSSTSLLGTRSVELKAHEEPELEFRIDVAGPIHGVVRSAGSHAPLAGAQVHLFLGATPTGASSGEAPQEPTASLSAITGPDGVFHFDTAPVGTWHARVSASKHVSRSATVVVPRGGAPPPLEMELTPGVSVRGRVEMASAKKPSWSALAFQRVGDAGAEAESAELNDETLAFAIDSLAPARYRCTLSVWMGGDETAEGIVAAEPGGGTPSFQPVEIDVPAGGLENVVLKFQPAPKPAAPAAEKKDG